MTRSANGGMIFLRDACFRKDAVYAVSEAKRSIYKNGKLDGDVPVTCISLHTKGSGTTHIYTTHSVSDVLFILRGELPDMAGTRPADEAGEK